MQEIAHLNSNTFINKLLGTWSSFSIKMNCIPVYPLANYSFGEKDPQHDQQAADTVTKKMLALKQDFEKFGLRTRTEAVIIVHEHDCPHLLLLSAGNTFFALYQF